MRKYSKRAMTYEEELLDNARMKYTSIFLTSGILCAILAIPACILLFKALPQVLKQGSYLELLFMVFAIALPFSYSYRLGNSHTLSDCIIEADMQPMGECLLILDGATERLHLRLQTILAILSCFWFWEAYQRTNIFPVTIVHTFFIFNLLFCWDFWQTTAYVPGFLIELTRVFFIKTDDALEEILGN